MRLSISVRRLSSADAVFSPLDIRCQISYTTRLMNLPDVAKTDLVSSWNA